MICKIIMRGFESRPGLLWYIGVVGPVAESVYAHDLKSCPARDVGSIPTWPTKERDGVMISSDRSRRAKIIANS